THQHWFHKVQLELGRETQILTDIKGSFQSLDVGCDSRDTVDPHLLHPAPLDLLHALPHDVRHLRPLSPEGSQTEGLSSAQALSSLPPEPKRTAVTS
uniref:Uncharacterized protein n=1 Tax=Geospiza parvula TaxID=87175 RepID=A0A8C3MUZ7_GEOPR